LVLFGVTTVWSKTNGAYPDCGSRLSLDPGRAYRQLNASAQERQTVMLTLRLLLLPLIVAAVPAMASQDAGGSHNLLLQAALTDNWFLISRSNIATRNDFGDAFLTYTGVSLGYRITPRMSLRLGYRRAWFHFGADWQPENRVMLEGYFADRVNGFRFTNRLRAEGRYFDWRDDDLRLRNEITVEAPWKLTALALQPYLEEEVFYSTHAGHVEANWLGGGLAWRPAPGVKLKLGYRWNHFRAGDNWANRHVLVTGISLFF
jgi:hypothetical protein